jgi:formate--tetrahydrofolate ligase
MAAILTDLEIAQAAKPRNITEVAKELGLTDNDLEQYGRIIGKVSLEALTARAGKPDGKLILVRVRDAKLAAGARFVVAAS